MCVRHYYHGGVLDHGSASYCSDGPTTSVFVSYCWASISESDVAAIYKRKLHINPIGDWKPLNKYFGKQ